MNVEGLWGFATGSVEEPTVMINSGVVVLETGRVVGGDSAVAYVGNFEASGRGIRGEVHTFQYNMAIDVMNVFGQNASDPDQRVGFEAEREGDRMRGHIWPLKAPDARLPMEMLFLHKLPG